MAQGRFLFQALLIHYSETAEQLSKLIDKTEFDYAEHLISDDINTAILQQIDQYLKFKQRIDTRGLDETNAQLQRDPDSMRLNLVTLDTFKQFFDFREVMKNNLE
jgi:hypothetical protein